MTVTFVCVDSEDHSPKSGTVSLNGAVIGQTNIPVTATFTATRTRVDEPGDPSGPPSQRAGRWVWEDVEPEVVVTVPGYQPARLTVHLS